MTATIPRTVIAVMTTPGGQVAIDAATRRNGRVFAAYIVLLIVSALLIAYFTWLTWDSGNKVQDAIQGDATARIAEATSTALQADARSKQLEKDNLTLQGQVASLQTDASDAKAAQQRVEIDLAKQQERAANAEKSLLDLKERVAWRTISSDDISRIGSVLSIHRNIRIAVGTVADNEEAVSFSEDIANILKAAHWQFLGVVPFGNLGHNGLDYAFQQLGMIQPDWQRKI